MDAGVETLETERVAPEEAPAPRRRDARAFAIDTGVVALTQLVLKLRGVVTLPLIARTLGTAEYGIWSQVIAFTSLAVAVCNLNLHLPMIRFIAEDRRNQARIYSTLLLTNLAMGAAGAACVFLFRNQWSDLLFPGGEMLAYLAIVSMLILLGSLRLLNVNLYRATGRLKVRSIVELVASFGELAGICVLLMLGHPLLHVFAFMVVWQSAVVLFQSEHARRIAGWARPDWAILGNAVRYALPLLPATLSGWVLDRSDRFVIGAWLGPREVGIYSANYALASMVMLFQAPLQMSLFPKVAEFWARDQARAARYISASNRFFLLLAIPFTVGVSVLARPIFLHLGNQEIAAGAGWTTWFVSTGVALWGLSIMQSQAFHGAKRTTALGAASVAAGVLNLVMTLLLVPRYGIVAAAFSTFVAFAALCAFLGVRGRGLLPADLVGGYVLKAYAASGVMALYLYWLAPASKRAIVLAVVSGALLYGAVLLVLRPLPPAEAAWLREAAASARRALARRLGGSLQPVSRARPDAASGRSGRS